MSTPLLILASASPRRRELLALTGFPYLCRTADLDEALGTPDLPSGLWSTAGAEAAVEALALQKAKSVATQPGLSSYLSEGLRPVVVGSDTVILHRGEILGKPADIEEAERMLRRLSGETHEVITAAAIWNAELQQADSFHLTSRVRFYPVNEKLLRDYLATGSSLDKAGAYGIQDQGALLIEWMEGDYHAVMGLPVAELYRRLLPLSPFADPKLI